ncbi:peptide MFS transporter [Steroidobacter sp.]|uniref:peptide MFS transporter n=1 Tax=Steroidobacter sp. TaxID=1978227 RepID=UPI001A6104DD|nr:peptide MFS transporter [Steroidobacter sp.]MBL8270932.1 peptide MFS transporter [Steroidobacter sp.]
MTRPLTAWYQRHPPGVFLVAFTEMWERFSYWGFAGIFVLFLTADAQSGGWGWQPQDALRLYGWYGGLAFIVPVLGAWLANNHLGERRCVLWGGIAITAGHLCLAGIGLVPAFKLWFFAGGLVLIVAGTGLLKPAISSIVARLYPESGARRDEGFAYFFVGIYVGALAGALVTGFVGERFGWTYGLTVAGGGMAIGLVCYVWLQQRWLGDLGRVPVRASVTSAAPLSSHERQRLVVIVGQGVFTVLYAAAFYQMFGLLNLYAHEQIERRIGSFEVPTTWLQTINLWSFFIFVPCLAALWRRLALRNRNPSASYKLVLGLSALAIGYVFIAFGEGARGDAKAPLVWIVITYALFGLGDALVWASQISLTSKLAPPRYSALLVGSWYVCIGLGTWLTGYIGSYAQSYPYQDVFYGLAGGCAVAAAILCLLTPAMIRWMHGGEDLQPASAYAS